MKSLLLVLASLFTIQASAKVLNSGTIPVQAEIAYFEVEVQAKCLNPKFEDDSFRVYFEPQSYSEVKNYLNESYTMILLDRKCGNNGMGTDLTDANYETVRILFYSSKIARQVIDLNVKDLLDGYNIVK